MIELDGCERKLWRDVVVDGREPDDLDAEPGARRLHRFELVAAIAPQAELQSVADDRLLDRVGMGGELVADRGPDEIGAVGVESFPHQEIDVAEIDKSEVDGDFFTVRRPVSGSPYPFRHRLLHHPSG